MTPEARPCPLRPPYRPSLGEVIGAVRRPEGSVARCLWRHPCSRLAGSQLVPGAGPSQGSSRSLAEWKGLYLESGFIVLFSLLEQAVHSRARIKGCPWSREATSCSLQEPGRLPELTLKAPGVGLISRVDGSPQRVLRCRHKPAPGPSFPRGRRPRERGLRLHPQRQAGG